MTQGINLLQDIKDGGIEVVGRIVNDFKDYLDKFDNQAVVVKREDKMMILSNKSKSRYFPEGRKKIQRKIYKRLGSGWHDKAVMVTLEFNPYKTSKIDAWMNVNEYVTTFIKSLNQRLRRRFGKGYKNIGFIKTIEMMPYYKNKKGVQRRNRSGGYPHVHIIFPGKSYLVDIKVIESMWQYGFTQIKRFDDMGIVNYLVAYIGKMKDWNITSMAYIWAFKKRIYSYSMRYRLPDYNEKKSPEWVYGGTHKMNGLLDIQNSGYEIIYSTMDISENEETRRLKKKQEDYEIEISEFYRRHKN